MHIKNRLVHIPQAGIILFIVFNILAMILYSGTTMHNELTTSYSFSYNFLSDLGRYMTYNGENNFFPCLFFNLSMIVAGSIMIIFFWNIESFFNYKSGLLYWLVIIGSSSGIAGGYSMIGVALTPADLYLNNHILFANWLFRFFVVAAACYTIIIFKSELIANKYAIGYCVFACLILLYILVSELGPDPREQISALQFQVIAQKSILLCFLFTVYFQTKGLENIID